MTDSNWNAAASGSISGTTSADVATFSTTITGFGKSINVEANRNIAGISFGNTSSFGFTLTGGNLLLTSAGVIQTLAADTGVSTAGNTTTLNLNGTNIGGNVITDTVANGSGGGKRVLTKSDAGT